MSKRTLELFSLSNNVAIITGGASGQGKVAAELFAEQGARVVVADIDLAGAQSVAKAIGGAAVRVDVAKEADVKPSVVPARA